MDLPTNEELRAHWDIFASVFADYFESSTVLLSRGLIDHLHLGDARAVLEIGAGPGRATQIVHAGVAPGTRIVACDLSPNMVALARARLAALPAARPAGLPDDIDTIGTASAVEVVEADCEALPFASGSFDRLLANLCLMLVVEPARALSEAHRVLVPGAIAAWSVWGRPEHSPMFTIPAQAARHAGIELPDKRSNFHLGDREALMERVRSHGFERVLGWHQAITYNLHSGAAYAELIMRMPRWQDVLADRPAAQTVTFATELAELAQERLDAGEPLALDTLVIVARRA